MYVIPVSSHRLIKTRTNRTVLNEVLIRGTKDQERPVTSKSTHTFDTSFSNRARVYAGIGRCAGSFGFLTLHGILPTPLSYNCRHGFEISLWTLKVNRGAKTNHDMQRVALGKRASEPRSRSRPCLRDGTGPASKAHPRRRVRGSGPQHFK